jgi:hypothetical protein
MIWQWMITSICLCACALPSSTDKNIVEGYALYREILGGARTDRLIEQGQSVTSDAAQGKRRQYFVFIIASKTVKADQAGKLTINGEAVSYQFKSVQLPFTEPSALFPGQIDTLMPYKIGYAYQLVLAANPVLADSIFTQSDSRVRWQYKDQSKWKWIQLPAWKVLPPLALP